MTFEVRWAPFPDFPRFEVSTDGRIRRIDTGREMTKTLEKDGYSVVTLSPGHKQIRVCRAVALVHIPNPENKPHVNHIDAVRSNDLVTNLEWVTHTENVRHCWRIGNHTAERLSRARMRLLTEDQIRALRSPTLVKGDVTRLAAEFGINRKYASQIRSGRAGNYSWVK